MQDSPPPIDDLGLSEYFDIAFDPACLLAESDHYDDFHVWISTHQPNGFFLQEFLVRLRERALGDKSGVLQPPERDASGSFTLPLYYPRKPDVLSRC